MEDTGIIHLFEMRNEQAISETQSKYQALCNSVAARILGNPQDAEECVSDVMLQTWNAIPPAKPNNFPAFLSTLTRNAALTRYRHDHRAKRGGGELAAVLDELADVIPDSEDVESAVDGSLLREALSRFLDGLSADARTVFVRRCIEMQPVSEIAESYGMSESKVKVTLLRTRKRLRAYLKKEGLL